MGTARHVPTNAIGKRKDTVEVVWHHNVVIQFDGGSHDGSVLPFSNHKLAKSIWMHDAVSDTAEDAFVLVSTDRDEICAGLGVVVVLQADGTAVMLHISLNIVLAALLTYS